MITDIQEKQLGKDSVYREGKKNTGWRSTY